MKMVDYESWWKKYININKYDPGTKMRKEIIENEIKNKKVNKILDLGCGSGELLVDINSKYPDKLLFGGDISVVAMNELEKYNVTEKLFKVDLNKIIEIKEKFDMVVMSELIEHLSNWKFVFTKLSGLLNKGGMVIITTQSGKKYYHHKKVGHLQHFNGAEICKELRNGGFKICRVVNMGWPFMNIKNVLASKYMKKYDGKVRFVDKLLMKIFYYLYKISSKNRGPQLIVIAEKL